MIGNNFHLAIGSLQQRKFMINQLSAESLLDPAIEKDIDPEIKFLNSMTHLYIHINTFSDSVNECK